MERIASALQLLREKSAQLQIERDDYVTLLEKEALRLLRARVEPRLREFRLEQTSRLLEAVGAWAAESPTLTGRTLQAALHTRVVNEIRGTCDVWRACEELELAKAFDVACQRFWHALQQQIDQVLLACGELFHTSFAPVPSDSLWEGESDFYYKFWSEPPTLRLLSSSLIGALPNVLSRKLIVERARKTAAELIEMQCGRLRADFDARLRSSLEQFRQRITSISEALLTGLSGTIEAALVLKRDSEADIQARARALTALMESATALEARAQAALSE